MIWNHKKRRNTHEQNNVYLFKNMLSVQTNINKHQENLPNSIYVQLTKNTENLSSIIKLPPQQYLLANFYLKICAYTQ